ncbi:MAG: hypothetical protein P8M80_13375 [Pirellulaceae bacterium]|nr:hypothetical protein [Pirellulaceae bacterium]
MRLHPQKAASQRSLGALPPPRPDGIFVQSTVQTLTLALGWALAMTAAGCRTPASWCDGYPSLTSPTPSLEVIEWADREPIQIPSIASGENGSLPIPSAQIEPLSLSVCEQLAAQHAPIARVLTEETTTSAGCRCSNVDPKLTETINAAILSNAQYQKNLAAEKALLVYLGLTEVHLQNSIALETTQAIKDLSVVVGDLQKDGILKEVDPEILVREKLSSDLQSTDLVFNFQNLNDKLRLLLGLEDSSIPIWTSCQILQWEAPSSLVTEIETGLNHRHDLSTIGEFVTAGDEQILEIMRGSVRAVSPLAAIRLERRIFGGDPAPEIQKIRSQLALLLDSQVELMKSGVTEHFYSILKHKNQLELTGQKLSSLRKSQDWLNARRQVAPIKVEQVLEIEAGILATRAELIHAAIEMQRSWIRMKSQQGLLGNNS